MPKLTGQQAAEKHLRRTSAAVPDFVEGVKNATTNPMEAAAAQEEKYKANVIKALESKKWQKGLKRVSFQDWKDKTANEGANRIEGGLRASLSKTASFHEELGVHTDKLKDKLKNMPSVTKEQNRARLLAAFDHMSGFQRKG